MFLWWRAPRVLLWLRGGEMGLLGHNIRLLAQEQPVSLGGTSELLLFHLEASKAPRNDGN